LRNRSKGALVANRARDALAQVPLFAGLSPRHLKRIGDLTEEVRFMEGASVVRHGDAGDTFFVILEGEAKVQGPSGRVVNRLRPGEFFGEISLLDGGPRTASVVAETPLTMLALSRSSLLRLVQREPAVGIRLLSHVAMMLRRLERSASG
jgi:CRP/FNR family transcriptional regulator, cyclic AMP receptor protein